MLETILIVALSVLTVILTVLLVIRHRREKGAVMLREEAVNDLIASMTRNAVNDKIQDIAGSVSDILRRHLACHKIVFVKYFRGCLEMI